MRRSIAAMAALFLLSGLFAAPSSAATRSCERHFEQRRELAHGRFLDRRWELEFFRDGRGRPCLVDSWGRFASIHPYRVKAHRPRLGMLDLAATGWSDRTSAYVFEGYVSERVARMTFRLDGRTDRVRIVRSPDWTHLGKDLFIHLVRGGRYDRDATGRVRAFDSQGRFLGQRLLRRRDFYETVEVDG